MAKKREAVSGGWRHVGPGGGGTTYLPTVDPRDWKRVILNSDMTGVYSTADAGRSWRMLSLGLANQPWAAAWDPVDEGVFYWATTALLRTDDFGKTWKRIAPETEPSFDNDEVHPVYPRTDAWPGGLLTALAIDPADNNTIYLGSTPFRWVGEEGRPSIVRSVDRGQNWQRIAEIDDGEIRRIFVDRMTPPSRRALYAATDRHFYKSDDGGAHWEATGSGLPPQGTVADLACGFDAAREETYLYLTMAWRTPDCKEEGGIFMSRDRGESWRDVTPKRAAPEDFADIDATSSYGTITACTEHGEAAYVTSSYGPGEGERFDSIMATRSGGEKWECVLRGDPRFVNKNVEHAWIENDASWLLNWYWGTFIVNVGVWDKDPDYAYFTDLGRAYRTTDGGKTWENAYCEMIDDKRSRSVGLEMTTCYGVHFDPFEKKRLTISYTDIGMMHSRDGGDTWERTTKGVPWPWSNTCYWLEHDPDVKGRAWGAWASGHDFPRSKMYARDVRRYRGGVCVSDDGCATWRKAGTGLPDADCAWVMIDPASPARKRTLLASIIGWGIYKSIDGGETWKERNKGVRPEHRNAWHLARDAKGAIYATFTRGGTLNEIAPGAIYRSKNKGESWECLESSEAFPFPSGVEPHPKDAKTLYVACWQADVGGTRYNGGVYKTTDGARTWKHVLADNEFVFSVTIDPKRPETVYAATWLEGVLRSDDGGATWGLLGGQPFRKANRVILDPYHKDALYIATMGGGVLWGPREGFPKARPELEGAQFVRHETYAAGAAGTKKR
jgi:photosystem II stability/assembly factor-like uncharacterized protein